MLHRDGYRPPADASYAVIALAAIASLVGFLWLVVRLTLWIVR